MRRFLHGMVAVLVLSLLSISACEESADPPPRESLPRDIYPAGPYGTSAGAVIEDLSFLTAEGESFSLGDVFADPANRLLLLVTSAGWCTSCIEEQPVLQSLFDSYGAKGLSVMVALLETGQYKAADSSFVRYWKEKYRLSFHVVGDPQFVLSGYYDADMTPMVMLVELDTMKILSVQTGFDRDLVESVIAARL